MLRLFKRMAAVVGFVAVASASHAATVNVTLTDAFTNVGGGFSTSLITENQPRLEGTSYPTGMTTPTGTTGYSAFYGFTMGSYDALMTFVHALTVPTSEVVAARYIVYEAQSISNGVATIASPTSGQIETPNGLNGVVLRDVLTSNLIPFFQVPFVAGANYVLEINKQVNDWESFTTNVSAVPLPGAALLFGTALAGFFGFSNRRKV